MADWIRQNTPQDARIGAWNAGVFGYFSERQVINLDGFANDRTYLDRLKQKSSLIEYLKRENIHYLCDTNLPDGFKNGQSWDTSNVFRNEIPMDRLRLLYKDGYIQVLELR